jgi:hypothetical protein
MAANDRSVNEWDTAAVVQNTKGAAVLNQLENAEGKDPDEATQP